MFQHLKMWPLWAEDGNRALRFWEWKDLDSKSTFVASWPWGSHISFWGSAGRGRLAILSFLSLHCLVSGLCLPLVKQNQMRETLHTHTHTNTYMPMYTHTHTKTIIQWCLGSQTGSDVPDTSLDVVEPCPANISIREMVLKTTLSRERKEGHESGSHGEARSGTRHLQTNT